MGPETLLGTQAGLTENIMSGLMVMGIGHLRGIAIQGRKKSQDTEGLGLFDLTGLHLGIPQPFPYVGIKTVGLLAPDLHTVLCNWEL